MKKDDILRINPISLHPTQFCLGYKEIEYKEKIINNMNQEEFERYLIKKITPVIIGPNNTLYLIDHHHHSRSLINLNKTEIVIKILEDFSSLSEDDFINKMISLKYVNLFTELGEQGSFQNLPSSLLNMKHDLYRSLAWAVRENNGFKKVDEIPFFEFRWGEYFRKYITSSLIIDHFDLATQTATALAKLDTAKHLPGFLHKN